MDSVWALLCEGFDYDLWANRLWFTWMTDRGLGEPDTVIFQHIFAAQEVWLRRCQGESVTSMPMRVVDDHRMASLHDEWVALLGTETEDRVVDYRRTTGEPHSSTLSAIASHVIDHGTYHRGELRGLCLARSVEDFPESGYIGHSLSMSGQLR